MEKIEEFIGKVFTIWGSLGVVILLIASQGVTLPDVVLQLFEQTLIDELMKVVGVVMEFIAFAKLHFGKTSIERAKVTTLDLVSIKKIKRQFAFNPLKFSIA